MTVDPTSQFVRSYLSRQARDHWSEVIGVADRGGVVLVRRGDSQVAIVDRDEFEAVLAQLASFDVEVSFHDDQVSLWVQGFPVHGTGSSLEEAEEDLLDALLDYAQTWVEELRYTPNHKDKRLHVLRLLLAESDPGRLHSVVFGDGAVVFGDGAVVFGDGADSGQLPVAG